MSKKTRVKEMSKAEAPMLIWAAGEEILKMTKTLSMMTGRQMKLERAVNNQMRRKREEGNQKSQKAEARMLTWATTTETLKMTKILTMTTDP